MIFYFCRIIIRKMQREKLLSALSTVIHPGENKDIVTLGMVGESTISDDEIRLPVLMIL